MIKIDDTTPTSTLLEIKKGDVIGNDKLNAKITNIEIKENDEFLTFYFSLENQQEITVKKRKQVC